MNLSGLSVVNVELSNRCNKNCHMCGRRKVEVDYPELAAYDNHIDFKLLELIAEQLPPHILAQLHWDGEPTVYPELEKAINLFDKQITSFNTNGILLLKKATEIIGNLDTLVISIIENDPTWKQQYGILEQFLKVKGKFNPNVILRCLGHIEEERWKLYNKLNCIITKRILHNPMGSFGYKKEPVIPEHGICLDFLSHMAINSYGDVSICVRFDPEKKGVIGNVNEQTLEEIWNGPQRMEWLELHKQGKRTEIPLCSGCEFWGVPRGD